MNNLEMFKRRAMYANNDRQHDRMVEDKLRSFHRALLYSYQAAWIKKDEDGADWCRALINPDKVKFDYDEKIVSVDYHEGFAAGDSFEWPKNSGIHWLILKQELTELAYFRGNVRRCQLIETIDTETGEKLSLWCAVRGPVETKINTIQKAGLVADVPNLTLDVYVKRTDATIRAFNRYKRFKFMDKVWKVTAPDWISTPGILEFSAIEDYDCDTWEMELIPKVDPNDAVAAEISTEYTIAGNTFTKPQMVETFTIEPMLEGYEWSIVLPAGQKSKLVARTVDYQISEDKSSITVQWKPMTSGSYELHYGPYQKIVVVESLF